VSQILKQKNPDIILLAYLPTVSYNEQYWTDALHLRLKEKISREMELYNPHGEQITIWPGTVAHNLANPAWRKVWTDFAVNDVYGSGYWDGIFLDEVASSISWVGATDLDQNGAQDNSHTADLAWKAGYADLFATLRSRVGNNAILITNGTSESLLQENVNGRMFESFPTPWEGNGRWEDTMRLLFQNENQNQNPDVFFLNGNTNNSGQIDLQKMRFGLTSALLGGAFFGYDFGTNRHADTWTFDEYDVFLGRMVSGAKDMLAPLNDIIRPSVWSRDFQNGKVLVNATTTEKTIQLEQDFEKVHGDDDPVINNGHIVSEVTIPANDGLVLLRPIEKLTGVSFPNGSFVRIFDRSGVKTRSGFFAYTGATLGGDTIVYSDINGDEATEIISANKGIITVHDQTGIVLYSFSAFDKYRGSVSLAVGDVLGDGRPEIVVAAGAGGGPHIRVYDAEGHLRAQFFAYTEAFRGGVRLALGDTAGDKHLEIVTGAGPGGGPHIRIFNGDGRPVAGGFFPYPKSFRGGVNIGVGDLNGDGKAEIIATPGKGAKQTVTSYNANGTPTGVSFAVSGATGKTDTLVAASDVDGDGKAEILTYTTDVFTISGN
ncbi:MAG: putative glycoside hydrolase, partial [Patescibacteria group bacterium]